MCSFSQETKEELALVPAPHLWKRGSEEADVHLDVGQWYNPFRVILCRVVRLMYAPRGGLWNYQSSLQNKHAGQNKTKNKTQNQQQNALVLYLPQYSCKSMILNFVTLIEFCCKSL